MRPERDEAGAGLCAACERDLYWLYNRFPRGIPPPPPLSPSPRIRRRIGGIICGVSVRLRGPIRDTSQSALGCAESPTENKRISLSLSLSLSRSLTHTRAHVYTYSLSLSLFFSSVPLSLSPIERRLRSPCRQRLKRPPRINPRARHRFRPPRKQKPRSPLCRFPGPSVDGPTVLYGDLFGEIAVSPVQRARD